jgi:hypothetical protein
MDLSTEGRTMRTGTDNQNNQARMLTELAHRAGDGIEVLLLWDRGDGRLTVVVHDLRNGDSFELAARDGRQALDAFNHPFAYAAARGLAYSEQGLLPAASAADEPGAPPSTLLSQP